MSDPPVRDTAQPRGKPLLAAWPPPFLDLSPTFSSSTPPPPAPPPAPDEPLRRRGHGPLSGARVSARRIILRPRPRRGGRRRQSGGFRCGDDARGAVRDAAGYRGGVHPGGRAHALAAEQARPHLLRRLRAVRAHAHRSGSGPTSDSCCLSRCYLSEV